MPHNWVLVADSSRALLFKRGSKWDDLELLRDEDYPPGRAHDGDLVTGDGAAVMQSAGQGQRRMTETEVSPSEHQAGVFARKLADSLRKGRVNNEYSNLTLVAAPAFLGELRAALDEPTRKCVEHEIDKDLTQHSVEKIGDIIANELDA